MEGDVRRNWTSCGYFLASNRFHKSLPPASVDLNSRSTISAARHVSASRHAHLVEDFVVPKDTVGIRIAKIIERRIGVAG